MLSQAREPERRIPAPQRRALPARHRRPTATVVICAYSTHRVPVLRAAVASVLRQLRHDDELVVVIDHNEELLAAARADLTADAAPALRVIANHNRRGLSGARNAGVAAARGELVAFLDDDAVPRADWLARLTEGFAEPEVIGAGGVAAPDWVGGPPAWLPQEFLWVVGCSYRGLPQEPEEIRNPIGATMAFRRTAILQAGGFTDGIGRIGRVPLGCEETELSIRVTRSTGGRILHQPAALVDHVVTAERLRIGYFLHRCWAEGISKAFVSRLAGNQAALASERRYSTRTLPSGVYGGLRDGLGGDLAGFKRAAAIVAGLLVTVAGYLRGSAALAAHPATQSRAWVQEPTG